MMCQDPMEFGGSSTPKIRQNTENKEHIMNFGQCECIRSYDCARGARHCDIKVVMQYQPQDR